MIEVEGLDVAFRTEAGLIQPARNLSFRIERGEVVGLVGESGSGKSVTAKAMLGLVEPASAVRGGSIRFRGRDLRQEPAEALRRLRGRELAMIFQDPMGSLNPLMTIGTQLERVWLEHGPDGERTSQAARARAVELLEKVRIPDPARRLNQYPHQFSGGMRQRVMIAMALMCRPAFLVADEPTTALDVTVELQVVEVLRDLQAEYGMAMLFISHNLTVVSRLCDRIMVMYAGRIVESGTSEQIFRRPRHPYTRALLGSIPRGSKHDAALHPIQGDPPRLGFLAPGCPFAPRCPMAGPGCDQEQVLVEDEPGQSYACHRAQVPA
ncbi:ABC transporter ATP-binding protein [Falsiroseomonas sp. E2-1-a20]|uniref:ABC transporter ATP-binding protein n=1 Tax=Falsiroseomonas sp. E2-1-a20 TaxID=3239300 RepID=UPI003F3FC0E9